MCSFTLFPSAPRGALGRQRSAAASAEHMSDAAVIAARTPAVSTRFSCASVNKNAPNDAQASSIITIPLTPKMRGAVEISLMAVLCFVALHL